MNAKDLMHETADVIIKELYGHLKKIVESLEIGNGCEEAECLAINTSSRCFVQSAEELLEFINGVKLKVIVGNSVGSQRKVVKNAKKTITEVTKQLGLGNEFKNKD
jgi:hypothetical protein